LDAGLATQQKRVGGRPTLDLRRLPEFIEALNRWLPNDDRRLLWVDHWDDLFPSACALFVMARAGLGESRSIADAPGHLFEAHSYHERDQLRIDEHQSHETGILIGLASLLIMNGWDGWLLSEGSLERVEFWEGNLFFHSSTGSKLEEANRLLEQFECPKVPA
jgi:hypothetical protein